jgi:hypothetical protein
MAVSHTITATFQDYEGNQASCTLQGGTSMNDAEQWGEALKGYSRAKLVSVSHNEKTIYPISKTDAESWATTLDGEHYDNVKTKCKLLYRDNDVSGRISMRSLQIPAPNDNCFDSMQEPTSDLAEDIADAIANSSTTERNNLQYLGGGLHSRIKKKRKKLTSGV